MWYLGLYSRILRWLCRNRYNPHPCTASCSYVPCHHLGQTTCSLHRECRHRFWSSGSGDICSRSPTESQCRQVWLHIQRHRQCRMCSRHKLRLERSWGKRSVQPWGKRWAQQCREDMSEQGYLQVAASSLSWLRPVHQWIQRRIQKTALLQSQQYALLKYYFPAGFVSDRRLKRKNKEVSQNSFRTYLHCQRCCSRKCRCRS
jgi:hypothetical protein